MIVLGFLQQLRLVVDDVIEVLGAEHGLAELLIAHLNGFPEGRVLQQALPESWRRLGVTTLIAPVLKLVGITETVVTISEIIVPHRSCMHLSTRAVLLEFLLVEIGASLVAVGIQAQFGMDEVVHK